MLLFCYEIMEEIYVLFTYRNKSTTFTGSNSHLAGYQPRHAHIQHAMSLLCASSHCF